MPDKDKELWRIQCSNLMRRCSRPMFEIKDDDEAQFWIDTERYREEAS
jgi:hypothetical protein